MHFLGIGLLAAAGVVLSRWFLDRVDGLGRVRSFPWISVGGLALLGLVALVPWFLRERLERELAAAATVIAGRRVEVNCQSFGEAFVDAGAELGYVRFGPDGPEPRTLVKREQCAHLADYVASDQSDPSLEQVIAVHTLTHEAVHMSGVANEAETECLALQRDAELAGLLGASSQEGHALAVHYWERHHPRMPDEYRSAECHPGGGLDEGGSVAPWDAPP